MKKDASPERNTSCDMDSNGSEGEGRRQRKAYVKPTITMCEPMVNVTLFSAGVTPESTSPPFVPTT